MNELRQSLFDTISETISMFYEVSSPKASDVAEYVISNNAELIDRLSFDLSRQWVRMATQRLMKKTVRTTGSQLVLDLGVENVPAAISFEVAGENGPEVRFIPIERATLMHLDAHIDLLNKQIVADTTRRDALMALRVKLLPLLQRGETVAEAASAVLEKSSA